MTLKLKLIGMTGGMVLTMATISYVQFGDVLNKQKSAAVESVEGHAVALSNSIGSLFFERYHDAQAFALNEALRKDKRSESELTGVFDEYVRLYGVYDVILLVDLNGRYIASNARSAEGRPLILNRLRNKNYSTTPWFKNTLSGQFSEEAKKGLIGSFIEDAQIDPVASAAYGENRLGSSFTTIVRDTKGSPSGVLTLRTGFHWIENEIRSYYSYLRSRGLSSAAFTLVGKSGLTLIDYDRASNGGHQETVHDFDRVVLKQNLAEQSYFPAQELARGASGTAVTTHPVKKVSEVTGFTSLRNVPKILESLGWGLIVSIHEKDAFAAATRARNQFLVISAVVMLIFAVIAYWFSMTVGQKLKRLSDSISETSGQVMAGSEQMSSASQSLASTATQAASSLEETVSSIEQLAAMVKRNAEHAMEAATLSGASRDSADVGEVEIQKLVEAMNEINQSSKKIEDIINVIDDIAFQTNLLALNAAVEAARAGDQGKGFAVVAEEVRNLAQRSAAAAKDITSLIKENVEKIEAGVEVAGQGGSALRAIVTSVRKVADLNSEIASASKEQSQGLEQISQAMAQLDQVTQTNAASAEEVASSAEEMSSQGHMLQETVSRLNALIHGGAIGVSNVSQEAMGGRYPGSRAPNQKVIPMRTRPMNAEKVIPFDTDPNGDGTLGFTSGF